MYEADPSAVVTALTDSSSPAFTDAVVSDILNLITTPLVGGTPGQTTPIVVDTETPDADGHVTVAAGTSLLYVDTTGVTGTIVIPSGVSVVVFQGTNTGGVNVEFNDTTVGGTSDGVVDRIVIGSGGSDTFVFHDSLDTQIVLGSGHSTVVAGHGNDTIVAGTGNSTIDGGGGDDVVQLTGSSANYDVVVSGGTPTSANGQVAQGSTTSHVVITNKVTGVTTDLTGVQYVQTDANDALILASSNTEAGVADLYHAAFGRTGEAQGIQYWFHKAEAGESLADIALQFGNSDEFKATTGTLTDTAFVTALYQNTFNRAPDASGLDFWTQQLSHGTSRVEVMTSFAAVAALNNEGTIHTEATIVGHVTIVQNIV
jgi:hypothetical protein